ncbi:MAG: hypothetical protein ABII01_03770 [Candidatus Woesearchaeota archaeon]
MSNYITRIGHFPIDYHSGLTGRFLVCREETAPVLSFYGYPNGDFIQMARRGEKAPFLEVMAANIGHEVRDDSVYGVGFYGITPRGELMFSRKHDGLPQESMSRFGSVPNTVMVDIGKVVREVLAQHRGGEGVATVRRINARMDPITDGYINKWRELGIEPEDITGNSPILLDLEDVR